MEQELLGVDEAARVLGLGRTKVYALIRDGELPLIKIGRSARLSRVAIREFVERKEAEARAQTIGSGSCRVSGG